MRCRIANGGEHFLRHVEDAHSYRLHPYVLVFAGPPKPRFSRLRRGMREGLGLQHVVAEFVSTRQGLNMTAESSRCPLHGIRVCPDSNFRAGVPMEGVEDVRFQRRGIRS